MSSNSTIPVFFKNMYSSDVFAARDYQRDAVNDFISRNMRPGVKVLYTPFPTMRFFLRQHIGPFDNDNDIIVMTREDGSFAFLSRNEQVLVNFKTEPRWIGECG